VRIAGDVARVRTRSLGDFVLHALESGMQALDGGAMFGVVPKPLWERRIPADERNRIPLALRCLLVQTPELLVLVETGLGNRENERFRDIYGVDNAPSSPEYPDRLLELVAEAGFAPGDVGLVVNTHLHFDHAGGNTHLDDGGELRLSFPNARHVVQRGEWEWAHATNERTAASYLPDAYEPVMAAGRMELVEGDVELAPGISVVRTPGHCPHHQSVLLSSGGDTACYLADVVPTFAHLPLPWIMGYDVEPLVTLESKRGLLGRAADEGWLLVSTHDPFIPWGRVERDGKRLRIADETTTNA
jgi:glyoxylase-like metal-dependent hydrolase (beta-lactamase superfamily II)